MLSLLVFYTTLLYDEIHSQKQAINDVDWQIKFILMMSGMSMRLRRNEIENEILAIHFHSALSGALIYFMFVTCRPDFYRNSVDNIRIALNSVWKKAFFCSLTMNIKYNDNIFSSCFLVVLCCIHRHSCVLNSAVAGAKDILLKLNDDEWELITSSEWEMRVIEC